MALSDIVKNSTSDFEVDTSINFNDLLAEARSYIASNHVDTLADVIENKIRTSKGNLRAILEIWLSKHEYIKDSHIKDKNALIDKLISEMSGFGFLDELLYNDDVEEICGNAWDDIEVIYADGRKEKYKEHFRTPQVAIDQINKLMQIGGKVLDNATPTEEARVLPGVRLAGTACPICDKDVAASFAIRRQRKTFVTREQILEWDTATTEMLDFLEKCVACGISVLFAGETGSGKTTNVSYLLSNVELSKRIITIEEDTREFDLVRKDDDGNIITSVIHWVTRPHENESMNVSAKSLARRALRYTPDIIVLAEMRGEEAFIAVNASITGHSVISTLHAAGIRETYERLALMFAEEPSAHSFSGTQIYELVVSAFPIIVHTCKTGSGKRKIVSITEGLRYTADGGVNVNPLFKYDFKKKKHIKIGEVSERIQEKFNERGDG